MNGSPLAVRKLIVGIIALGCLATAASLLILKSDGITNPATSVTMRLGIMLGALWLALPNRDKDIAWQKALVVVIPVIAVLAFVRNWRILLFLLPAAIVVGIAVAFLRPKSRKRPPRQ
ncbi:MAG TPA: hypothetical protein VKU82_01515 [Planctomycetaceae bacterium]|nr:hypothetical protein [Planctomycetaceae bacterium]